ncbi:M67 family metallopeptidase [soil metagenome]
MKIDRVLLDDIVAHAVRDAPNECCGMVAVRDGAATAVHATENVAASPFRFEVDSSELIRLWNDIESAGADVGAIYHSHTRSDPYPSQTDVNFASNWPGVEWIIVGVDKQGQTEVHSYLVDDGQISEVELELT